MSKFCFNIQHSDFDCFVLKSFFLQKPGCGLSATIRERSAHGCVSEIVIGAEVM